MSVEESAQSARSLRAWPVTLHLALATRVAEIAGQWAECWQVPGSFDVLSDLSDETSIDGRDPIAAERWNAFPSGSCGTCLWWATSMNGVSVPPQRLLSAAMFDETGTSTADERIADALVAQAWQDWCERLTDLFEIGAGPSDMRLLSPTAIPILDGAVLTRVSCLGGELHLIIGSDLVQRWATANRQIPSSGLSGRPSASLTPQVPLLRALDDQAVALSVELSKVTVDVGALIALQMGERPMHQPSARLATCRPDCNGRRSIFTSCILCRLSGCS